MIALYAARLRALPALRAARASGATSSMFGAAFVWFRDQLIAVHDQLALAAPKQRAR